jgi:hypothetical protein
VELISSSGRTLGACYNLARVGSNVNSSDQLIMPAQLVLELKARASTRIELDIIVAGNGQSLAVGREGMIGNGVVEEVVDFGRCHVCYLR